MCDLIKIENVSKQFHTNKFSLDKEQSFAVKNVSINIKQGCSLGLIGESGSGKTTLGRMICRLENVSDGDIYFRDKKITNLTLKQMLPYRKNIQMVFQNSTSIFDPSYTIGETLREILLNNKKVSKKECDERINEILNQVELKKEYKNRYPNQLSGGEKQRANIARALIINPEFVVCDEPVSSLDFSIRKQILDLLNKLKKEMGLTYLFISHDLSTVKYACDSIAIMYRGEIVEYIEHIDRLEEKIKHPYTKVLFNSVPSTDPLNKKICVE